MEAKSWRAGASDIADEHEVSSDSSHGFAGDRGIGDEERQVFRRVAWSMEDRDPDQADAKRVTAVEERRAGVGEISIGIGPCPAAFAGEIEPGAGPVRELAAA